MPGAVRRDAGLAVGLAVILVLQPPEPTARRPAQRPPTLQRVLDEPQLADDVAGNVGLYALTNFGVALSSFQEMVELLRVKLLGGENQAWSGSKAKASLRALHDCCCVLPGTPEGEQDGR